MENNPAPLTAAREAEIREHAAIAAAFIPLAERRTLAPPDFALYTGELLAELDRLREADGRWLSLATTTPNTYTPALVAAPSPSDPTRLITLRRTFLYIADGVFGVHGKMERTRADITHFRYLPEPPAARPCLTL